MSKLIILLTLVCLITSVYGQSAEDNGNAAYNSRDFHNAIPYYKEALKEQSTSSELLTRIGHCYRYTNQSKMAIKSYQHAIKQANVDPIVHFWLGTTYKSVGMYDEAKSAFQQFEPHNVEIAQQSIRSCEFAVEKASSYYEIESAAINSPKYDDYAPVFYKDDVLFTSSRKIMHTNLPGGFSDPCKQNFLFRTDITSNGGLEKLRIVKGGDMFLPTNNVAPFTIHPTKDLAISTYNTYSNGVRHIRGAALSSMSMEEHSLKNIADFMPGIKLPWIKNGVSASFPCFIENGNAVLFAAEGLPNSLGGYDLYRADKNVDGTWNEPIHLGDKVNSSGDEICPFMDGDGNLYFSSDFLSGYGGFDVFISRKINGTWSNVKNLGPGLNTGSDELYFVYSDKHQMGLFSSDRNGNLDIFKATPTSIIFSVSDSLAVLNKTLDEVSQETEKPVVVTVQTDETQAQKIVNTSKVSEKSSDMFIGAIQDSETDSYIEGAYVYVKNITTNEEFRLKKPTNQYGEYSALLASDNQYQIIVSKTGYSNLQFDINIEEDGRRTILGTRQMELSKVVVQEPEIDIEREMSVVHHTPNNKELIERPTEDRSTNLEIKDKKDESTGTDAFVIQAIAVHQLSDDQQIELKRFGNLIIDQKDDVNVYKVGYFMDKSHVERSLAEVRSIYPDAFVRTVTLPMETIGDRIASSAKMIYPPGQYIPNNMAARGGAPLKGVDRQEISQIAANKQTSETNTLQNAATIEYRLQIGVLTTENDAPFDHLKDIGNVSKEKLNGKVYYFLGGSKSLDAISILREKAIKNGVTSSFVVPFVNGVKSTMKDL